ncbi:hypothetical protein KGA66_28195 [Actinocrinis puniceicyclus]|uniref:Trypsin-co-occurring domain-containing protein n=1 Tax=Actinocrinis puniceicyclus TaxID=977794 RepID=A0A8J7WSS8_9ACTN|nr:CU044_2847 family protein [Actinocrinis puniceicyclus]MBS2966948.1 hypothetical protein [Actinocrinis puniceicyclus]
MSKLVRFELDGGGTVLVEPAAEPGIARASIAGEAARNAAETFQAALSGVRAAAAATLREFTSLPHQPDEVTVEFGVRLDAQAGAIIARSTLEGHLQVTLLWKKTETAEQPEASG